MFLYCTFSQIVLLFHSVVSFLKKKCSKASIIQWYNYYRDIITTWLSRNLVIFTNVTVHIDETAIGGRRKYNKGRIPKVTTRWLFGIIDQKNHKVHVEFVGKRDHDHIIPIITHHCTPGCVINSNGAKVYKTLNMMNYVHNTIIHKDYFVDPVTKVHTNWIENFWSNLKSVLKSVRGSQGSMMDGHIDEYIYHYNRKNEGDVFTLMLNDISTLYPV